MIYNEIEAFNYLSLATVYLNKDLFDEAYDAAQKSLEIKKSNEGYKILWESLHKNRKYKEALNLLLKELDDLYPETYICVGRSYQYQKDWWKAEEYYEKAKNLGYIESYRYLGDLYSTYCTQITDYSKAIKYYIDLLNINEYQNKGDLLFKIANTYKHMKNDEEAIRYFKQGASLDNIQCLNQLRKLLDSEEMKEIDIIDFLSILHKSNHYLFKTVLGMYYRDGVAVLKNLDIARYYLEEASKTYNLYSMFQYAILELKCDNFSYQTKMIFRECFSRKLTLIDLYLDESISCGVLNDKEIEFIKEVRGLSIKNDFFDS